MLNLTPHESEKIFLSQSCEWCALIHISPTAIAKYKQYNKQVVFSRKLLFQNVYGKIMMTAFY